ncbi:unnamed protein product [Clonostachys rosea f. rosea IK726]|uniref:Uncharacterized protein n=1 Tax=Clonostachys rosea f. rosea IK726 TaxID=1349383 RepID=A0ACA9UV20_BIOOC|nr:unnamed protein product [Clonostachys rosea f. rosea IK726]
MADPGCNEKRRRTACWKCKERRVKCSLETPRCRNCIRSNHQCHYGLKLTWREEALAQGICFGRQGVYGRPSKAPVLRHTPALPCYRGSFYFLNASSKHFVTLYGQVATATEAASTFQPLSTPLKVPGEDNGRDGTDSEVQPEFEELPAQDEDDWSAIGLNRHLDCSTNISQFYLVSSGKDPFEFQLFDYYVNALCPNLSSLATENPYRDFIAPLSLTSKALYFTVLSWAAYERSYEAANRHTLINLSTKYKVEALRWLRQEVISCQEAVGHAKNTLTALLATMITLSGLEIVETCSSTWMAHLKAGRAICNILWPGGFNMFDKFQRFCVTWLVTHDVMGWRISEQETLFEPREWFATDDEIEIDATIVCSRGLVKQISEVSALIVDARKADMASADPEVVQSFRARRDRVERTLHHLRQQISTDRASDWAELLEIAECKRLCALIYLYAGVDGVKPLSPTIQPLTAAVVRILARMPPKPTMIFPLFIVGTFGAWAEDERRMILDKFTEMANARPLASILKAKEVVQAVWLDRDVGKAGRWEDLAEQRGNLLSLA